MRIFSVNSHSALISRFFIGCKVDVILSDQDSQVHGQEAWSMCDLLQDDGSAYTHVYPSECQLDDCGNPMSSKGHILHIFNQ